MPNFSNDRKPSLWWLALLLTPFVGVLWVPFFNRVNPEIGGLTIPCYAALASLVINLLITAVFTWLFNIVHAAHDRDETVKLDYQEATS